MVEVKEKEQGVDSGVFGTFFSLGDLAQIAGVLTAAERLSELADEMDSHFGEVGICREVVRGVRTAITAIHTMGGVLYSVPLARRMLSKYDVQLSAWARFKMAARFYARRQVVLWILASVLSAAAVVLLVARFAIAAYGAAIGTVPVAALGYLAAAIGGICLPLAACAYMLKQIKFVYDRFVESVKVAKAIAHERTGVGVIDGQEEDHLPSAYFTHSVSDYDLRKSQQLVWSSSICLAISIISLCVAFMLDALFPLKSAGVTAIGATAPSLTLWYDFVVVGLSFMVGALLVMFGSSQFLQDDVALAQLRKAILEAADAKVLLRGSSSDLAWQEEAGPEDGLDSNIVGATGLCEGHSCACDVGDLLIVSAGDDVHGASQEEASGGRISSFTLSDGGSDNTVSQQETVEKIQQNDLVSPEEGTEQEEAAAAKAEIPGVDAPVSETLIEKDESEKEEEKAASQLHDATVASALLDVERQVA